MTWESLILLEQQAEFYQMKSIQDALSNLTVFSYHLILIAVKRELEIVCQLVEAIRKLVVIRQIKRCRFHQIKTGLSEHLTMG